MNSPSKHLKVSLSFADSCLAFADSLAQELTLRGCLVFTDSSKLSESATHWGKHKSDLIHDVTAPDMDYCIVLISEDYRENKWTRFYHDRFLELAHSRSNTILPVQIGEAQARIRGLEDIVAIMVAAGDHKAVADKLFERIDKLGAPVRDLETYDDLGAVLAQMEPAGTITQIAQQRDYAENIGYDLYQLTPRWGKQKTFFLQLCRRIAIEKTATHFRAEHRVLIGSNPLIVIMPRERHQVRPEYRRTNVKDHFLPDEVFYLNEFLKTGTELETEYSPFDIKGFIDPAIRESKLTATTYLKEWLTEDAPGALIVLGGGGIGKTTVVKHTSNLMEMEHDRRVIFVSGRSVVRYANQTGACIDNLYQFYLAQAMEREDESTPIIHPVQLKANLHTGNLLMVIDGLDEVITRLGMRIDVEALMTSIYHHVHGGMGFGRVIITCRNYFLPEDINPNVRVMELLPFNNDLARKYFRERFPEEPAKHERGIALARQLTRIKDRDTPQFIPFVLDQITYILADGAKEGDPIDDPSFDSKYLDKRVANDYLIYKICARERSKHERGLQADEQIAFFISLAVKHQGIIKSDRIKEALSSALDGTRVDLISVESLLSHPLLAPGDTVRFKYDVLDDYFCSVLVGAVLNDGEKVIDEATVEILARRTSANPAFLRDCSVRIRRDDDEVNLNLISLIGRLRAMDPDGGNARAVSGLFQIGLDRLRKDSRLTRDSATRLMKDLFAEGQVITGLSLVGVSDEVVFDFSGLTLRYCTFDSFDSFWRSTFDRNTWFESSILRELHIEEGLRPTAGRYNFDLKTCSIDESVEDVLSDRSSGEKRAEKASVQDLRMLLRLFHVRGRLMPQKVKVLRGRYQGRCALNQLLTALKAEGIVEAHESHKMKVGPELHIADRMKGSVDRFVEQGTMSAEIRAIVEKLARDA